MLNAGMMYNLRYVRNAIQDRQASKVCDATGLSRHTFYRVRDNTGNVSSDTVKALSDYLMQADTGE